jgi:hypothetical protein
MPKHHTPGEVLRSEKQLNVSLEIDDLAEFVFCRNVDNKPIELSLGGIASPKDLFCFAVDMLCKGLVLMFGTGGRVVVEELSFDQISLVQKRMKALGIQIDLVVEPPDEALLADVAQRINIREVMEMPQDLPLDKYVFRIRSTVGTFAIRFSIVRVLDQAV